MTSRLVKIVAVLALAVAVYSWLEARRARAEASAFRSESIAALASAASVEELAALTGGGLLFAFADGRWIAVRYSDSHERPMWSVSVGLDSEGRWIESGRHFCAALGNLQRRRKEWLASRPETGSEPGAVESPRAEQSPDLEHARTALQRMGFVEFDPGLVAKTTRRPAASR